MQWLGVSLKPKLSVLKTARSVNRSASTQRIFSSGYPFFATLTAAVAGSVIPYAPSEPSRISMTSGVSFVAAALAAT